jgi:hypothetical protein
MKISRQRGKERPSVQDQASPSHERMDPELSRKDIVAVIIAMFQLFLPLIVGLIAVGAVVALILR